MKKSKSILLTLIILSVGCTNKRHKSLKEKDETYVSTNGYNYHGGGSRIMMYPHLIYSNGRSNTNYSSTYRTSSGIKNSFNGKSIKLSSGSARVVSRGGFGHSVMSAHS